MGGGGMAGPGPGAMAGDDGQLPPHLLQAMQHGMDEEMLLADMLGNIPADQAAELQRLVQEGDLQMLSCLQILLLSCYRMSPFFSRMLIAHAAECQHLVQAYHL